MKTDFDKPEVYSPEADFHYKIILVGNRKVGKTSITNRCVFDEFDENSASTKVVQIVPTEFNVEGTDKIAKVYIWDTLG